MLHDIFFLFFSFTKIPWDVLFYGFIRVNNNMIYTFKLTFPVFITGMNYTKLGNY